MANITVTSDNSLSLVQIDLSRAIDELGFAQGAFDQYIDQIFGGQIALRSTISPTQVEVTLLSGASVTLSGSGLGTSGVNTINSAVFDSAFVDLAATGSIRYSGSTGAFLGGTASSIQLTTPAVDFQAQGSISVSASGAVTGTISNYTINSGGGSLQVAGALRLTGGTAFSGTVTGLSYSDPAGTTIVATGMAAPAGLLDALPNAGAAALTGALYPGDDVVALAVAGGTVIDSGAGNDRVTLGPDADLALGGLGNDTLLGGGGNDTLLGGGGNDRLDGEAGADSLDGGPGNDVYVVDHLGDTLAEALGGGMDRVESGVDFTLGANFENLVLTGAAVAGTGNSLNNLVTGNGADNLLAGGDGNDTLIGGEGNDTLAGGAGNDNLSGGVGNDSLDGGTGNDMLAGGPGDDIYAVNAVADRLTEAADAGTDTVYASLGWTLGAHLENLVLMGTGNLNGTGNAGNNVITGNAGDNLLAGATGTDTLAGGPGNDTYLLDSVAELGAVVEAPGEGTADTLRLMFSVSVATVDLSTVPLQGFENVTALGKGWFSLIGNGAGNVLTGNTSPNLLDGGGGDDTLIGGGGNDVYIVDSPGDVVTARGPGIDTVRSTFSYTLAPGLEHLALDGTGNIDGTGNAMANAIYGNGGANVLRGGAGMDWLDGGAGNDTLDGGAGNDTYFVDSDGDVAEELLPGANGIDLLFSSAPAFTLGAGIENLMLAGTADIGGTGNGLANVITGNSGGNALDGAGGNDRLLGDEGGDTLRGDLGNDTLTGGAGNDRFVFDTAPGPGNVDTVADFLPGTDRLQFDDTVFAALGAAGPLDPASFVARATAGVNSAADSGDHLIYNTASGRLYYDADGAGGATAVQVAMLAGHPALTAADIDVLGTAPVVFGFTSSMAGGSLRDFGDLTIVDFVLADWAVPIQVEYIGPV